MKLNWLCLIFALLTVSLWGLSNAHASKDRIYNFVEFVMRSDLIVVGESVQRNGDQLDVSVKEFVHGTGPQQIKAAIVPQDRRERAPAPLDGEKLVFLAGQARPGDRLELFGAGVQAVWPQTGYGALAYPSAKDVKTLVRLCRQVRGSLALNGEQRVALITQMASSSDLFIKLVGFQFCNYLYSLDRLKYKPEVEIGAAYALEALSERDPYVFYEALELALAAPPSTSLPKFLEAMRQAPERAEQNAAFIRFTQVSETRGKFDFQANTDKPDEKVRAEGLEAVTAWLDKELPRLIVADSRQILEALNAEDPSKRRMARVWLQSAAGQDFGYREAGTAQERAEALGKVKAWLQKVQAEQGGR